MMLMMMLITVMVIVILTKLTMFLTATLTVLYYHPVSCYRYVSRTIGGTQKVALAAAVQAPTAASTAVASKHTLDHQESYRPVQAPTASSTAVAPKHTLDHRESYRDRSY